MKIKRLLCAVAAAALLMSSCACGKDTRQPAPPTATTQATQPFTSAEAAVSDAATAAAATAPAQPTTKRVFYASGSSKSLLITDIYAHHAGPALPQSPATREDFVDCFRYFIGNRLFSLRIPIDEAAIAQAGDFTSGRDAATKCALEICPSVCVLYPECASKNNLSLLVTYSAGAITISRKSPATESSWGEETARYNKAVTKAKSIVAEVTASMPAGSTDYDLACALMQRLADGCSYDSSLADLGYTAYGALIAGSASCVGYVAGCAMLFKAAGISCVEVNTETHSWLALKLGGKIYWADPTFADDEPYDERYFPSESQAIYTADGQHTPLFIDYEETKQLWK